MAAVLFLVALATAGAPAALAHEEHLHAEAETDHRTAEHEQAPGVAALPASSPSAPDAHEHHHNHRDKTGVAKFVAWLGNFHPPMVHFPIAMLLGAAIAETLLLATGREPFGQSARFCLWLGALCAVPTAVLGWFFGGFALVDESWVLTTHRWLGTTTGVWAVCVLYLREFASRRTYRAALFLGAVLVSATGFFGGALVYGLDHYMW